ncbi:MAG: transposase family protein, partial [Methylocystis sp.]
MPVRVSDETIVIKLIREPGEIEYYSDLVSRRHYLASSQINRNTILHVARQGRRDVAVLTWEPAVRRWFGKRDRLIGWTAHQREQRLKYCVENRRFLMLSEEKNLASKVLSLSIERLGKDGQEIHGHEFLIAETFVDPTRGYDGTCYKAAGWTDAGLTQGGRGKDDRSKKLYFVKELKLNALAKLKAPELTPSDTKNPRQSVLNLERLDLQSLRRRLDAIPDRRKHKGWYPMTSVYALMIASVLCGETTAKGMWRWISELSRELLRSLGCRQAPSYSMIWSSLRDADHAALQEALCGWLAEQGNKLYVDKNIRILSLDGKALRSASKAAGTELHLL